MANTIKFETQRANGTWREWKNVVIPVKYGMLLDEQLDYATVTLMRIRKREFKPLTRARLTVDGNAIEYFIASDDFYEAPVGSKAYNHELTLIELTKLLECFPLETLCFTNPSGNNYGEDIEKVGVMPTLSYKNYSDFLDYLEWDDNGYKTPSLIGTEYKLVKVKSIINTTATRIVVTITNKNGTTTYNSVDDTPSSYPENFSNLGFTIAEGENIIEYAFYGRADNKFNGSAFFTIYGVANRYPLKPWTINDVIKRILQLVEPLRKGQKQRFTFTPPKDAKAKVFEQFAPEFTLTRQTLREALQTVGGFIHAEPILKVDNDGNFIIDFDFYGEQEYAEYINGKNERKRLSDYKYKTLRSNYNIEQASTKLDSYQDNLVNRVSWEQATIGQPYKGGVQTLRTETAYIRGEEQDSYFFPTTHNIDRVVKFEYIDGNGAHDITPYVFEMSIYNTLSSYTKLYPSSKSYALHYTNGEKGIKGFFYKVPSKLGGGVEEIYSIVNIIKAATGSNYKGEYPDMRFRLTYVPIYSTRVQQSRAYLKEYLPLPRVLNYTQSDNSVEARFFGENIKGAISRMGNVEKTYTLNLRNFNNIPKAGKLWDDDYYIASVSVAVNADLYEVSVGLSKNFNRKSQYIGASSYKRMYEISETMVQERHTVYTDYIVFTDTVLAPGAKLSYTLLQEDGFKAIASVFSKEENAKNIVAVEAHGCGKDLETTQQEKVLLPVIASAFGNAMEFTWEYKDNFSAGIQSEVVKSAEVISGTFGKETEYTDYYGRMYYYYFSLLTESQVEGYTSIDADKLPELIEQTHIDGMAGTGSGEPLVERKDSRETPKKSYVVEFVTDNNSFVIGSAIASLNPLVNHDANRLQVVLYILPYRVNKFATTIDLEGATSVGTIEVSVLNDAKKLRFSYKGKTAIADGKAWAYAIPTYAEDGGRVEDEDGNEEELILQKGGELLLAKNGDFARGATIGDFYAYLVHDIYDYLKLINN